MKTTLYLALLAISVLTGKILLAQVNSVGSIYNSNLASDGYILFSPNSSTTTYLIDNCGREIHNWTSNYKPGLMAYLLDDGSLIKTGRIANSTFSQGGIGGVIEIIDWEGNINWSYQYSDANVVQHHDIEVLPNGNILILAAELKTSLAAVSEGRNPNALSSNELWPEHIIEIEIQGSFTTIVWEWHAWDHLIQNFDASKNNFGDPGQSPELFDINYYKNNGAADWQHMNAIDYNPELDQILLSSKTWSEIYIIDHSTTSTEAASHTGGNSGVGGDLLYRWGNPITYGAGLATDQRLFDQHDANWIPANFPNAGKIIIFNNQYGNDYSSVDIISPPLNSSDLYDIINSTYGPDSSYWKYIAGTPSDMFSNRISSASKLSNGNVLICSGEQGWFHEVDSMKNMVWSYINPVTSTGILSQLSINSSGGQVFRALKYDLNFPGFIGKDLTPGDPIELNFNLDNCISTEINHADANPIAYSLYPNPTLGMLNFESTIFPFNVNLYDVSGRKILSKTVSSNRGHINLSNLPSGVYTCVIENETHFKVIKQ